MLSKIYLVIFADAANEPAVSRDAFTSDWALSSVWDDDGEADIGETEILHRHNLAGKIYDLAHMTVADLAKASGYSNRAFALACGIPLRTMENWSSGANQPPDYVKLLLAESAGYFKGEEA